MLSEDINEAKHAGALELETRLWGIIDRDGLGNVPSDIVGAVSLLVQRDADRAALLSEVERLRLRVAELEAVAGHLDIEADTICNDTVRLVAEAVAAERERCLAIAEEEGGGHYPDIGLPAQRIAKRIRTPGASPDIPPSTSGE